MSGQVGVVALGLGRLPGSWISCWVGAAATVWLSSGIPGRCIGWLLPQGVVLAFALNCDLPSVVEKPHSDRVSFRRLDYFVGERDERLHRMA